ncbi:hypothetical protein ACQKFG_23775 [Peribacillus sp. NPDC076916]|uniref:hypothetical protein n=1 Tax=Peribacillus sp. NPDC076916 TaxID=3390608 RepID=UPI003D094453
MTVRWVYWLRLKWLKRGKKQVIYRNVPNEVVIFTDVEGARFKRFYRKACNGRNREKQKALTDYKGSSFEQVLSQVSLSYEQFASARRELGEVEAFNEIHIEQGFQLESCGIPVGIVNGIAGPSWLEITYLGTARHAVSTLMYHRKDALAALGELVYAIQSLPGLVS